MNQVKIKQIALAFVIGLASISISAHQLGKDATQAERAFTYRDSLLHVVGWKMGVLSSMAKGNREDDSALFAKTAREIADLAPSIPEGFIPDSIVDGSLAKPEIWENFDDFEQKAINLQSKALEIAEIAQSDLGQAKGMMRDLGGTCGACHRQYKVKK